MFRLDELTVSVQDCENMSDPELYRFLEENLPAVAETVHAVNDANRETVVAFLKFLVKEAG
jgi:hypothetical protein